MGQTKTKGKFRKKKPNEVRTTRSTVLSKPKVSIRKNTNLPTVMKNKQPRKIKNISIRITNCAEKKSNYFLRTKVMKNDENVYMCDSSSYRTLRSTKTYRSVFDIEESTRTRDESNDRTNRVSSTEACYVKLEKFLVVCGNDESDVKTVVSTNDDAVTSRDETLVKEIENSESNIASDGIREESSETSSEPFETVEVYPQTRNAGRRLVRKISEDGNVGNGEKKSRDRRKNDRADPFDKNLSKITSSDIIFDGRSSSSENQIFGPSTNCESDASTDVRVQKKRIIELDILDTETEVNNSDLISNSDLIKNDIVYVGSVRNDNNSLPIVDNDRDINSNLSGNNSNNSLGLSFQLPATIIKRPPTRIKTKPKIVSKKSRLENHEDVIDLYDETVLWNESKTCLEVNSTDNTELKDKQVHCELDNPVDMKHNDEHEENTVIHIGSNISEINNELSEKTDRVVVDEKSPSENVPSSNSDSKINILSLTETFTEANLKTTRSYDIFHEFETMCYYTLRLGKCKIRNVCSSNHNIPLDLKDRLEAMNEETLLKFYDRYVKKYKFFFEYVFKIIVECFSKRNSFKQLFRMVNDVRELNMNNNNDNINYTDRILIALIIILRDIRVVIDKMFELYEKPDLNVVDLLLEPLLQLGSYESNWFYIKKICRVKDYEMDIRHIEKIFRDCCKKDEPSRCHVYNVYYDVVNRMADINLAKISTDAVNDFLNVLKRVYLYEEFNLLQRKIKSTPLPQFVKTNKTPASVPPRVRMPGNDANLVDFNSPDPGRTDMNACEKIDPIFSRISSNPNECNGRSSTGAFNTSSHRVPSLLELNIYIGERNKPTKLNCIRSAGDACFDGKSNVIEINVNDEKETCSSIVEALLLGDRKLIYRTLKRYDNLDEKTSRNIVQQLIESKTELNDILHMLLTTSGKKKQLENITYILGLYLLMMYISQKESNKAYRIFKQIYYSCELNFLSAKMLEFSFSIIERYLMSCKLLVEFEDFETAHCILKTKGFLLEQHQWAIKSELKSDLTLRNNTVDQFIDSVIYKNIHFAISIFKEFSDNIKIGVKYDLDMTSFTNKLVVSILDRDLQQEKTINKFLIKHIAVNLLNSLTLRALFISIFSKNKTSKDDFYKYCVSRSIYPVKTPPNSRIEIPSDLHTEEIRHIVGDVFRSSVKNVKLKFEFHIVESRADDSLKAAAVPKILSTVDKSVMAAKERLISVLIKNKDYFINNELSTDDNVVLECNGDM